MSLRRINCKRYELCLMKAAIVDDPEVPCKGCSQYRKADPVIMDDGMALNCLKMWHEVFKFEREGMIWK